MSDNLFRALMKLLSHADDNDIRFIISILSSYWLGKGKLSIDEFENIVASIKKD